MFSDLEEVDSEAAACLVQGVPCLFTKFVMSYFVRATCAMLSYSKVLSCLRIERIPLRDEHVPILAMVN
jgi:hypothetical protein